SKPGMASRRAAGPGSRGIDDPRACLLLLGAGQTAASLTAETYGQRPDELLGTGLRWEHARRRKHIFGPDAAPGVPNEGQRCWIPYALGDRNANPNVPSDPAEPTSFPSGCTY